MQPGDIFKIDNDGIVEMENQEFSVVWRDKQKNEHRLEDGTQFRITKDGLLGLPLEVRASKIDSATGKCGRGRPRRFPADVIYRIFGETPPDPSVAVAPAVYNKTADPVGAKVADDYISSQPIVEAEQIEATAEEKAAEKEARRARVAAALGLLDDGSGLPDDEDGEDTDW